MTLWKMQVFDMSIYTIQAALPFAAFVFFLCSKDGREFSTGFMNAKDVYPKHNFAVVV